MAAHLLRVDTPARHRRFEAWARNSNAIVALFITAAVFLLGALFVLPGAIGTGDTPTIVLCLLVIVAAVGFGGWLRWRSAQVNRWMVPVHHNTALIRRAHSLYRALSPEARTYGKPVVEALYRLSTRQAVSKTEMVDVDQAMAKRVEALEALVAAEERLGRVPDSDDDTDAARIWADTLSDVFADLPDEGSTRH